MPSRSLKRTGFHLHPLLLHMVLKCFSTQTGREGRESCHRNVYKSRPEECKQSWVELLSDKRVNFRRSCCDLPVWSFHHNMALWRIILSEWITVLVWPSNWNKNSCLQEKSGVTGENWKWREWKSDWFSSQSRVFFSFLKSDALLHYYKCRLILRRHTVSHQRAGCWWSGTYGSCELSGEVIWARQLCYQGVWICMSDSDVDQCPELQECCQKRGEMNSIISVKM